MKAFGRHLSPFRSTPVGGSAGWRRLWLLACFLAWPGCATAPTAFRDGLLQEVPVATFPAGAEVWIAGELKGVTPLTLELGRKHAHRLEFRRAGYHSTTRVVAPRENERASNFVRFGLLRDAGYYQSLIPDRVEVVMDHELVPTQLSARPFEDMAQRIVQADALLARGEINAMEHRVLTQRIRDIYRDW